MLMSENSKENNKNEEDLFRRIDLGVRRGVALALAEHKQEGRSIFVWKDGQVVEIPPEEIVIDEELLKDIKDIKKWWSA
jgi:hypothetical protein